MSDSEGKSSLHGNLTRERKDLDVFGKYQIGAHLGQGSMGGVSKVRIRPDKIGGSAFETKTVLFGRRLFSKRKGQLTDVGQDHAYALKSIIIDRTSNNEYVEELQNEIAILRTLDHPNVVRLHEVYTHKKQIYLVLELCEGGDLAARSPYSEKEAARIASQIVSAVSYLHLNGVVHRDLKFENIMFENKSPGALVKLIDFGLSKKFFGKPKYMAERVGTIYTMAPEVLEGIYTSKADLWSIGVITYMLLCTSKPFYHKNRRTMVELIMHASYKTDGTVWDNLSDDAKDFVQKLLVVDPSHRLDAEQASKHPWFVNREQLPDEKPSRDVLASIDGSLLNFVNTSMLKKIALTIIAHRSKADEILELRKAFEGFDTARDGVLSLDEFKAALSQCSISDAELETIFSSVDTNKNGRINYTEFLAATIEAYGNISEDRIAEAFDRMDADDTGYISKKDLKEVLGDSYSQADIDAIMATGDKNRDGKISYKEFLSVFRNTTCPHIAEIALPPSERGSPVKRSGVPQSPSSAPLESGAVILESGQLA